MISKRLSWTFQLFKNKTTKSTKSLHICLSTCLCNFFKKCEFGRPPRLEFGIYHVLLVCLFQFTFNATSSSKLPHMSFYMLNMSFSKKYEFGRSTRCGLEFIACSSYAYSSLHIVYKLKVSIETLPWQY